MLPNLAKYSSGWSPQNRGKKAAVSFYLVGKKLSASNGNILTYFQIVENRGSGRALVPLVDFGRRLCLTKRTRSFLQTRVTIKPPNTQARARRRVLITTIWAHQLNSSFLFFELSRCGVFVCAFSAERVAADLRDKEEARARSAASHFQPDEERRLGV
jgi:hypothetical protein